MTTCDFHRYGRMESSNVEDPVFIGAGILGITAQTHHSITPLFHYSNWGEAPKFKDIHVSLLLQSEEKTLSNEHGSGFSLAG
jgi:hypothetical protein